MPSIEQLEKLLAATPGDPFVLYAIAQEHAKKKDVERAVEFFDRCLAADGAYCYAYFHKARVLAGAGRTAEAVSVLKQGREAAGRAGDGQALNEISGFLYKLE